MPPFSPSETQRPDRLFETTTAQLDIDLPLDFELTNPLNPELNTHAGVLEFIADEGCVNLPQWASPKPYTRSHVPTLS